MNIIALGAMPDSRCLEPHSYITPSLYYKSDLDAFTEAIAKGQRIIEKGKSPLKRIIPDLTDYDFIIVDLSNIDDIGIHILYDMSQELAERITTGAILLCFVCSPRSVIAPWQDTPISNFDWLPVTTQPRSRIGKECRIVTSREEFKSILERYLPGTQWVCDFNPNYPKTEHLAINKNNQSLALYFRYGKGHIVLLPRIEKRDELLRMFIREVIPTLAPQIVTASTAEEPPLWVVDWLDKIPGVRTLSDDISTMEQRLSELVTERDEKIAQKQTLERWGDLLWQTGEEILEERVREALRLLGLDAQKKYGVDVVVEDAQGTLYAEVEGTKNNIQVDKSRKLLEDISKADNPAAVRGAIIGNPFRLEQPENRPPAGQRKLFVKEVEDAAAKFGWTIITTHEIFNLVCRHLGGDPQAEQELRARLLG